MFRVIITFLAAAFIIYLSYVFSRYIGRGMNKSSSSSYMRLVDQITVGQDRYIAIMQIGEKYLLVGITAGQINMLTELKEEELLMISPGNENGERKQLDFRQWLDKFDSITKKGGKR